MEISERIKKIIEYYNISVRAFEKSIGASNNSIQTMIKRKSDVKSNTINKILQVYPDINPEWLLTGHGSMLKTANKEVDNDKNADMKDYVIRLQKEKIAYLENELKKLQVSKRAAKTDI